MATFSEKVGKFRFEQSRLQRILAPAGTSNILLVAGIVSYFWREEKKVE